jgi:phosphate transport system substrate-binding protein
MTVDQMLAAPGKILHFPTVLGAVVPVYNIPGVTQSLKFTGPVLADIFLGKSPSGTTRRSRRSTRA